jgi:drug/metabolite transporter (DMT)-like permease
MELKSGRLSMLLCVFCWSTSGLFIKFIDWHPMVISCLRSGIAALFMLAASPIAGSGGWVFAGVSSKAGGKKPNPLIPALFAAAFFSAATKMLYVAANKLTTPANAILLQHSAPVWAAFLGWFLIGEKLRKSQWAALAMVMAGLFLFFFNGLSYGSLAGDGIALLAGLCFAASMVFLRMNKDGSPVLALFLSHCIPVLAGVPFVVLHPPVFTLAATASILFLGLVQVGIASLLYAYSIKRLRAVDALFIDQLEPLLNPVWVFVFTGETPVPLAAAGGVIIIVAVVVASRRPSSGIFRSQR